MSEQLYYRWILINNQETCYTCIVKVLDGFFKDSDSVKEYYSKDYSFKEHLFSVIHLEISAIPEWLAKEIKK